jgi:uncharacterized protein YjbI with pentapeptide repeats
MREEAAAGNLVYALEMAQVMGVTLNLDGLNLANTDFSGMNLDGISFDGAVLQKCVFDETSCKSCNFTKANLNVAEIDSSDFTGATFDRAQMREAVAHDSNFTNASFVRTSLLYTNFGGSNFSNADLRGAILTNAKFGFCMMGGANFRGTNAIQADLSSAFTSAETRDWDYRDILYDGSTKWSNYCPPPPRLKQKMAARNPRRARRNSSRSPVPDSNRPYFAHGRDELVAMASKGDNLAVIELEEHRGRDAKTGQKKFGVGARISRKVR